MPRTLEMSKVHEILAEYQRAVAERPEYGEQFQLIDKWDREHFSQFVEYEFSEVEWEDFVDFCSHEQIPWQDWFEQWRDGGRKV